jgi:hypothetical protein
MTAWQRIKEHGPKAVSIEAVDKKRPHIQMVASTLPCPPKHEF